MTAEQNEPPVPATHSAIQHGALRVMLYADHVLVATSDDPDLWVKVFRVMESAP